MTERFPYRRRLDLRLVAILLVLGGLLAIHTWMYRFLTDDAFISFRYARNLAHGAGLVFNPGDRPVEGYSNFLWVVLLAGLARCGIAPEAVAPWLGAAASALLWLGTAVVGWRLLPPPRALAFGMLAPLVLALNRSYAVWATGGLETRLFEFLILLGLARLYVETRAAQDSRARFPWSSVILSLGVLTRPDGILIAGGALVCRDFLLWRQGRGRWRDSARGWVVLLLPIAIHMAWRLAYYGYPLPNTYYAKLDGRFMGGLGGLYLLLFALEYALVLWVPFVVLGFGAWRARAPGLAPLVAAGLVPYVAYIVYCGGDHFEYRLLDVVWVPLALLFQAGVAHGSRLLRSRWARLGLLAAALAVAFSSAVLPTLSHWQYPPELVSGFPGCHGRSSGSKDLVELATAPAPLRLPLVRSWVAIYDRLACRLTARFAGLRQEEHRGIAELTAAQGRALGALVEAEVLPADTRIGVNTAGAIPYYSGLWSLDRLGLCDTYVAHGPWTGGGLALAHGKSASLQYLSESGVELIAMHDVMFIVHDDAVRYARSLAAERDSRNFYVVARVGRDKNLMVHMLPGPSRLARFPRLHFVPLAAWEDPGAK